MQIKNKKKIVQIVCDICVSIIWIFPKAFLPTNCTQRCPTTHFPRHSV